MWKSWVWRLPRPTTRLRRVVSRNPGPPPGWCCMVMLFRTEFQQAVRSSRHPLAQLDDYCQASRFEVDLLLNQNIYAGPAMYAGAAAPEPARRLDWGFALLRRNFGRGGSDALARARSGTLS